MVTLSIILLRAAEEKFRGRVMGVRMMAIYSLPIGLLGAGRADRVGRLPCGGVALCDGRNGVHAGHRAALACPAVAGVSSGKQRREGER